MAFALMNPHLKNFAGGNIYTGSWKNFCAPGLNCYSCPAAAFSCPIGAMQAVASSRNYSFGFYVSGFLLAVGLLAGRAVCGFLCPFGLIQELIHKIPSPKIRLWKRLRYVKYAVLLFLVLILPAADSNFAGVGEPWFCEYVCPAGTLEAAVPLLSAHEELSSAAGPLFFFKLGILIFTLIMCVFSIRFFCKVLCPLGAFYGLLNRISVLKISVDKAKCTSCGLCRKKCIMEINPALECNSAECIRCGKCTASCPENALKFQFKI